jgi:hypothetical protein
MSSTPVPTAQSIEQLQAQLSVRRRIDAMQKKIKSLRKS